MLGRFARVRPPGVRDRHQETSVRGNGQTGRGDPGNHSEAAQAKTAKQTVGRHFNVTPFSRGGNLILPGHASRSFLHPFIVRIAPGSGQTTGRAQPLSRSGSHALEEPRQITVYKASPSPNGHNSHALVASTSIGLGATLGHDLRMGQPGVWEAKGLCVVQCACQAETEVRWSINNKNNKEKSCPRHSATERPTLPSLFKRACGS